jgi:hypothetical protein
MTRFLLLALAVLPTLAFADFSLPGHQPSALTLLGATDGPGCSKDTDCKGDRICVVGACQSPAPSEAPMPGMPPLPSVSSGTSSIQRLIFLDQRLDILELSRPSMAWPIFLTIFGGVGIVTSVFFVAINSYLWTLALVVTGVSLIPLTLGIVFWIINGARNRTIDGEISQLRAERASLGVSSSVWVEQPRMIELARF